MQIQFSKIIMFNSLSGLVIKLQYQQIRCGHRIRGKSPLLAKTLKQRLEIMNKEDDLFTTKIDIGFPPNHFRSIESRHVRTEAVKKLKFDINLEKLSRDQKLEIDLNKTREEWLKTLGPYHKKQVAEHYGIYEHLYKEGFFIPFLNIDVFYSLQNGNVLPVRTGNVIKPKEAIKHPEVKYNCEDNTLWTLVLTNLDGHLTENDSEYVHWLIANIPNNLVEKGETIVEYLQPFPLKGTGYHRYVFVLYKQDKHIQYNLPKVSVSSPLEERTFNTRSWYKKHQNQITPVGLAFYQSDWDTSVREFFHKHLSRTDPVFEYDFPLPYIKPQEWFPHKRQPFNIYMDRYRDPKQINKEFLLRKLKKEDPFQIPPPPLQFPNAHPLPRSMPSWLKLHEKKIRLKWGRVNEIE